MRKDFASGLDLSLPPVRIRDEMQIPARAYVIFIQEERVVQGELKEEDDASILAARLKETFIKHRKKLGT